MPELPVKLTVKIKQHALQVAVIFNLFLNRYSKRISVTPDSTDCTGVLPQGSSLDASHTEYQHKVVLLE